MNETNEKTRHRFVTFWLWASCIALAFFAFRHLVSIANETEYISTRLLFTLTIASFVANILVLNWKIIGVFITCTVSIAGLLLVIFIFHANPILSILFSAATFSIYFGILNIRKNGISVWKHLLNEAKAKKRETKFWIAGVSGIIILLLTIAVFPIKRFYGNTIFLFAPERIVNIYDFGGRVLGKSVLKTGYGEVRIGHLSPVTIHKYSYSSGLVIKSELFSNGQASHNLVLLGAELPKHISVEFKDNRITFFDPRYQDMSIYGVPARINHIDVTPSFLLYNFVEFLQEHITLADSTELNVTNADLSVYKDKQQWVLKDQRGSSLFVKRAGETEFTEYKSITFKPNWGEFIEGVLLEE